jgi:hypothetical protein
MRQGLESLAVSGECNSPVSPPQARKDPKLKKKFFSLALDK